MKPRKIKNKTDLSLRDISEFGLVYFNFSQLLIFYFGF